MKTTAPMATPIAATTAMTITMTQEEFDDSFDDIIHGGFFDDDDHGDGSENCFFPLGNATRPPNSG